MPVSAFDDKMSKSVKALENDLSTIRAGRANPRVLDKITVSYYGVDTPLNQVGNITVPEARVIQITPWEVTLLKEIEKSLNASDLGLTPNNDGTSVRLIFPELTEDRRKALTKEIKKKGEDTKVAVRNIRRDGMDSLKKQEKASEITEDELAKYEVELQKVTDKNVAEIDKVIEAKNKEILTV